MNVKFLRRIKLVDQPAMTYYEATQLFADPAGRQGLPLLLPHGGEVLHHPPSFGQQLKEPGFYEISGIAYSGTGRIAKVMVSADGGKSWGEAALQGPVQPQAFTRFVMPWRWDGQPAVLMSRAWDESGNAQPLRAEFVARAAKTKAPVNHRSPSPTSTTTASPAGASTAKGRSSMSTPKISRVAAPASLASAPARRSASRRPRPADHRGRHQGLGHHRPAERHRPAARQGTPARARRSMPRNASPVTAKAARAARRPARWSAAARSPTASRRRRPSRTSSPIPRRSSTRSAAPCRATRRTLSDNEVYALTAYLSAQQAHRRGRHDGREDVAAGEDAEPGQFHPAVSRSDLKKCHCERSEAISCRCGVNCLACCARLAMTAS